MFRVYPSFSFVWLKSSKLDSLLGMTPRDLVYMWLGITRCIFVFNIIFDIVHLYFIYLRIWCWNWGFCAWDFDGIYRGCFDDGFGEYMDIYPCRNSICRVGIWIWISDVLDEMIVEVFHRGVLVCGCGFSSHFHEMDLAWVFTWWARVIASSHAMFILSSIACSFYMYVAHSYLPC